MLERVINVAVPALFGAFVLAFCIFVWSASSCEEPSEKQNGAAHDSSKRISCEAFNVGFFKNLGVIVATHPNETAAGTTALATAVVAWFTLVLSRIGRQQARDNRVIEQAYVFPLAPQHQFLAREDQTIWGLRLWVPWKNSGGTPAVPVNSIVGATWVPNENEFRFGAEGLRQPFVLGPNAEIPSGTIDITAPHINDLLIHRQGHQFFWGQARFRDIFPNSPWHVVEFCFRVTIEGQLGPPPFTGRVAFAFYGPHNRYYDEPNQDT